jgi:hypothetical protein
MTPIHILFTKILVKMFHMSLKYIHFLHVSTSLCHLQVIFFFQEIYCTAHTVTRILKTFFIEIYIYVAGTY